MALWWTTNETRHEIQANFFLQKGVRNNLHFYQSFQQNDIWMHHGAARIRSVLKIESLGKCCPIYLHDSAAQRLASLQIVKRNHRL